MENKNLKIQIFHNEHILIPPCVEYSFTINLKEVIFSKTENGLAKIREDKSLKETSW